MLNSFIINGTALNLFQQ